MSRGVSGGKQVIKIADTSNRGRVSLFSQNERTIYLSCKMRSFATACKKGTMIVSTQNLPLSGDFAFISSLL